MEITSLKNSLSQDAIIKLREHIAKERHINSTIVVKSKKTEKDITFKLKSSNSEEWGYSLFIGYEVGYDTYTNCVVYNKRRRKISVFKNFVDSESIFVKGAVWILKKIVAGDIQVLFDSVELYHTGRCIKCDKKLTDLTSISFGMGSYCRTH